MKSPLNVIGLVLLCASAVCFQGCVTGLRAATAGVTTKANFENGSLVPMTSFATTDVIRTYVSVTWDDVTQEPGWSDVTWNWYKGDKLVGQHFNDRAYLRSSPNTRSIAMPAAALGTGHFRVECIVNGTKISSVEFDIN
jgi:hypothetical protein